MIDLHVHSTRSDGTYTPQELIDYAMKKGLSAMALTDHDTVDGVPEILAYAEEKRAQIQQIADGSDSPFAAPIVPEIIPGIELSTEYQGKDIHIVGLYIDHTNTDFQSYLQDFVNSRILRNRKMCELLQTAGMDITYEALMEAYPNSVITRAHYAGYMLKKGYIKSLKEAFDRYIGDHCPYYVPREKVTPEQGVNLILKAGGIPILAHPTLYHMSDDRLETLVSTLRDAGLLAIEAIYSTYTAGEERQMKNIAAKFGLAISGGSDFHGGNKPGLDLGVGYGKLHVPDDVLTSLKKVLP